MPAWRQLLPTGTTYGRSSHAAIYDPDGDQMVVYGGNLFPDEPTRILRFGEAATIGDVPSQRGGGIIRVAPNPATSGARIDYALAGEERVRIDVVDLAGRCVQTLIDRTLPAGRHSVRWNGRDETERGARRRVLRPLRPFGPVKSEEDRAHPVTVLLELRHCDIARFAM